MGSHKILKRLTSLLCAVSLFLSMISIPANAVTAYAVTATTNQTVRQGDTGYCYVYIDSTESLAALDVTVHFDPVKVRIGDVYNSAPCQVYDSAKKESSLQFSYILDGVGEAAKTQLFYFSYQVLDTAKPGSAYFDITVGEAYDAALNDVAVSASRCNFTIQEKSGEKHCNVYGTSSLTTAVAEEFTLNYRFSTAQIASGSAEIRYDPELFEVVEVDPGPFLEGKFSDINAKLPGSIYLSFLGTEYENETFLLSVKFRTLKNVQKTSAITFTASELCDLSLNNIICPVYTTTVTVNYDESYVGDAPTVSVSASYDQATEQITAVIRLPAKSRLGAGDFTLLFDPEAMTLRSYEKGFSPNFFTVNDKEAAAGILKFSVISLTDIVTEEILLTLTFDAIRTCNEQLAILDFSGSMITDSLTKPILLNFADGQVTIPEEHVYSGICDTDCDLCGKERQVDVKHIYDGITDNSCNVCGSMRKVQSITVSTLPEKTEYLEAKELLDVTGGKLTIKYEDGDTGIIDLTTEMISGFDNTVTGKQDLTVTYLDGITSFPVTIRAKSLAKIEVSVLPQETSYLEAYDQLDLYGGRLLLTYDNGTTKEIPLYDAEVTGFDNTIPGEQILTVRYGGYTTTFPVTIIAKTITNIYFHSYPKTSYLEGQEFDPTGLGIQVYYNNSTWEILYTGYTVTGYDPTPGEKNLTVSYGGHTLSFSVYVEEKTLEYIEVTKLPDKTVYIEKQTFDPAGMEVTAYYNNGTSEIVTGWTYSANLNFTGNRTVHVYYEGYSAAISVRVDAKSVMALELVSAPNQTTYVEGTELYLDGLSIRVLYDNGDVSSIYHYNANITGYDMNRIGVQIVTAEYGGKTVTFEIEVIKKSITHIWIEAEPDKTSYLEGEPFDPAGMVVMAYYNNDTSGVVEGYTVTGYDPLCTGGQQLEVTYQGHSAYFYVDVRPKSMVSIGVTTLPDKTEYLEGEAFDSTGIVVTAYYDNGTSEIWPYYRCEGYSSQPGEHCITVIYSNFTAQFNVKVRAKTMTHIGISNPPSKLTYIEGQALDLEGLNLKGYYDNGSETYLRDYTVSGYDSSVLGTQTVTLTYQEFTTSFEVTVEAKKIVAITIHREPDKMSYVEDTEFDPAGMELLLHYNNDTTEIVTDGWELEYDFSTDGYTAVKVSYQGHSVYLHDVWVAQRQVQNLQILTYPDKLEYIEGQDLDLSGLTLEATYDNGQTEILSHTDVWVEYYDPNAIGAQTVQVCYGPCSVELEVTVAEKRAIRIWISSYPSKQNYIEGQDLDLSGLELMADYDNGTQEIITEYMVSGYDSAPGQKTVSFFYQGCSTNLFVTVEPKSTVRIEVESFPDRMEYNQGEIIDYAGLTVRAYYNNGTDELITDYSIDYPVLCPGYVTVTINYMEVSTEFMLYVVEEDLVRVELQRLPNKLEYLEGDALDLTGMLLVGRYADGTTKELTKYHVSGYASYPGQWRVEILYGHYSHGFHVEVRNKTMVGLELTRLPYRLEYVEGTSLDLYGLELTARFDNGTTEQIWNYEVIGNVDTEGEHTITIRYNNFEVSFDVVAVAKSIYWIEVTKRPDKMQYIQNTEFDPTGMELTLHYDNDTTEVVTEGWTFSYNFGYEGTSSVKVCYGGHTTWLDNVVVTNRQLLGLQIQTMPDKVKYLEGEGLDLTGIVLEALYDNGESDTLYGGHCYVDGFDPSIPGVQYVTLSYGSVTTTLEVTVEAKSPVSIWVYTCPQREYLEGQELDLSGLQLWVDYNNGTYDIVTDCTVEGYDPTPGTKTLTITYQGLTTSVEVYVAPKQVSSIEIATLPDKINYLEGDQIDFTGLTVRAHYNNGTSELVEDYIIEPYNDAPGHTAICVSYMGYTAWFDVYIAPKSPVGIWIATLPEKLTYLEGAGFDSSGLKVLINFDNGTSGELYDYTIFGYDPTPGVKTITVQYGVFSATFEVTVRAKTAVFVDVLNPPKYFHLEGETLDLQDTILEIRYDNGDVERTRDFEVSGYDPTPGIKTVTFTAAGISATVEVCVNKRELTHISVGKMPNKLQYIEGQALDLTGLVIYAHYNNGDVEEITDYSVSGFESVPGVQTVTITYGITCTVFEVTVKEKTLVKITIKKEPTKTRYLEGENLDLTGLEVEGHYNNGTTELLTNYTVSGYDANSTGSSFITVNCGGKTARFQVFVEAKSLSSISISRLPEQLNYLEGKPLETAGLKVMANFNNGTSEEIWDYHVSGYDLHRPGQQTITVEYQGKTATFVVTVKAKTLVKLLLKENPTKQNYQQGEPFDPAGMVVAGLYDNGAEEVLTSYAVSGYDANTPGVQHLTVSCDGVTATVIVVVERRAQQAVTSDRFTVDNGQISKIGAGTKVTDLLGGIHESQNVKIFSGDRELPGDTVVGTGMTVKLMDGNNVMQTLTVVVTGDTNGDGKSTVTDMLAIKSHLLKKTTLSGAYAEAADTSADGGISITDFIQVKAAILGKGSITPN